MRHLSGALCVSALAAALSLPGAARADDGRPAQADPIAGGKGGEPPAIEVVVRGSTAGGFTSKISTDTAPREPIDAASLLAELPSVHVRRLGAEGSFAALSIRGSASSQVAVTLAGIPLTSAADPSLDVGSLPLWPGASFRIYRGFAPASLGTTGHLGGVLAIDPPSPLVGERTEWWTAAGSFGSLKLRIGDVRKVGPVAIGTGVFASRSDGDFTYLIADPTSGSLDERTRTNAGQRAVGGITRVALERPWGTLAATLFADARHLGVPGPARYPTQFVSLGATRLVVGADASIRTGASGAARVLAWGRRETSDLADPLGELDPTHATTTRSAIEAAGLLAGWRGRPIEPLTLGVTLDGRAERFVPISGQRMQASAPAVRLAGGLGADLEWRPRQALTVSGSGRVEARRDDASGIGGPDGVSVGVSGALVPTGHVGASYRLAGEAIVAAHLGALMRPPSFQELYGNGAALLGDASLRAERAFSADVGVQGDVGDARVALGYELVGFVTRATDLITFVPFGRAAFRAVNVDRAVIGGAEVSASLAAKGLRMQIGYTLLVAKNQGDDPLARDRPLPGRPRHNLHYDASYRFGPARVRYGLDAVAGTTVDTRGSIVLPVRVLHGVGAWLDVPWVPGLTAGADVANLFDLRALYVDSPLTGRPLAVPVSDFLGFPLPGRSVWLTLRFTRSR